MSLPQRIDPTSVEVTGRDIPWKRFGSCEGFVYWIQRHSMLAARQGGALPDLTIYRDERSVVARWMPDGEDSAHPFLGFTGSGEIQMDPDEVKRGLAELVDQVMDRLEGLEDTEVGMFREEWAGILGSTEEDREICEWSARLGLDPDDPDELADDQAEAIDSESIGSHGLTHSDRLRACPMAVPNGGDPAPSTCITLLGYPWGTMVPRGPLQLLRFPWRTPQRPHYGSRSTSASARSSPEFPRES